MNLIDFVKNLFKPPVVDVGYTKPDWAKTATELKTENLTVDKKGHVVRKVKYVPTTPTRYRHEIEQIRFIAEKTGYEEIDLQEFNKMISFKKGVVRINVYYSTMTVGTCLSHPKQGKTQLFRRNVSMVLLEKLFANPRQHTGHGYKEL